jgi:prepilin-type N-terminal cleavage/methylation domain-containing protein
VRDRAHSRRDGGFTLVELLIVISILGLIVSTLSASIVVILRTTPGTSSRIDDARTLRGMSTWLAHDVTSTPPFLPEDSNGGIDTATGRNDCSAPGSNVLHLSWTENDGADIRRFVSSYRYVVNGDDARITRFTCVRVNSGPFSAARTTNLTSGLSTTQTPVMSFDTDGAGRVTVVKMRLYGASGEQAIVDTSSRNPAAYLP